MRPLVLLVAAVAGASAVHAAPVPYGVANHLCADSNGPADYPPGTTADPNPDLFWEKIPLRYADAAALAVGLGGAVLPDRPEANALRGAPTAGRRRGAPWTDLWQFDDM